jgi:HTH-type transcriptional regulator, cell division transcriptional repressor
MNSDPVFTLGDRLTKAREIAGLSQLDMANALALSRNTVINYENGHTAPTKRKLAAWAAVTGVRVEWLSGEDASRPPDPIDVEDRDPRRYWRRRRGIMASPVNHNIPAPRVVDLRERVPA